MRSFTVDKIRKQNKSTFSLHKERNEAIIYLFLKVSPLSDDEKERKENERERKKKKEKRKNTQWCSVIFFPFIICKLYLFTS